MKKLLLLSLTLSVVSIQAHNEKTQEQITQETQIDTIEQQVDQLLEQAKPMLTGLAHGAQSGLETFYNIAQQLKKEYLAAKSIASTKIDQGLEKAQEYIEKITQEYNVIKDQLDSNSTVYLKLRELIRTNKTTEALELLNQATIQHHLDKISDEKTALYLDYDTTLLYDAAKYNNEKVIIKILSFICTPKKDFRGCTYLVQQDKLIKDFLKTIIQQKYSELMSRLLNNKLVQAIAYDFFAELFTTACTFNKSLTLVKLINTHPDATIVFSKSGPTLKKLPQDITQKCVSYDLLDALIIGGKNRVLNILFDHNFDLMRIFNYKDGYNKIKDLAYMALLFKNNDVWDALKKHLSAYDKAKYYSIKALLKVNPSILDGMSFGVLYAMAATYFAIYRASGMTICDLFPQDILCQWLAS